MVENRQPRKKKPVVLIGGSPGGLDFPRVFWSQAAGGPLAWLFPELAWWKFQQGKLVPVGPFLQEGHSSFGALGGHFPVPGFQWVGFGKITHGLAAAQNGAPGIH